MVYRRTCGIGTCQLELNQYTAFMQMIRIIVCLCVFSLLPSCLFGPNALTGVMSYRNHKVYLKKNVYYTIGQLPDSWMRMKSDNKSIGFYNDSSQSAIATDAFCGQKVRNIRLKHMSGGIISGLENRRILFESSILLDGRKGLRQMVKGELDGEIIYLDIVMVRKHGCIFDFYAIMPKEQDCVVINSFETFFNGFRFNTNYQFD